MIVSAPNKVLYLAPPKTRTTALHRAMHRSKPSWTMEGKCHRDPAQDRHWTAWQPRFQNYFIFITVRHPFDRMISLWKFSNRFAFEENRDVHRDWWRDEYLQNQRDLSLAEFLRLPKIWYNAGERWRCSWHLERIPREVDQVVYCENWDEGVQKLPVVRNLRLDRANSNPKPVRWQEQYTPETINMVQTIWKEDFIRFGYNSNFEECLKGELFKRD